MCTGQTKGGILVEEQTMGGTPSEGSITGGAPGEEDFVDKVPISTKWAKASVGLGLSPDELTNGNFGGTTGEGTKSREGTKECGCSKLTLREESNRVTPSDGTENSGQRTATEGSEKGLSGS